MTTYSVDALKWQSLTAAVNLIKSPNQFLKTLLWKNHQTLPTESIEISVISRGREIAPFVRTNGQAIMVGGASESFQTVQGPNIRLKKPFTPSELLFGRRAGSVIQFQGGDNQVSAVEQVIARDMQGMADMVTNAEEYLCAMALRGQIAYSVADEEVFQITFPRDASLNITLTNFWDLPTPAVLSTNPNPELDCLTIKRLAADFSMPGITDAILGQEASTSFLTLLRLRNELLLQQNVQVGTVTFISQFSDDGVLYLGTYCGIRFWEYSRTATLGSSTGASTAMIRSKYAEFVSDSAASDRVLYYAAIPDMEAFQGRVFQSERFSKSWLEKDPSALIALIHSRPLPVPRKVNAHISMKVVSG